MKKNINSEYEFSLADIIETIGQSYEQSRESCIDDSEAAQSDSPHQARGVCGESSCEFSPYCSQIGTSMIEKDSEHSNPTVKRGSCGQSTHSHSPYCSQIGTNKIDKQSEQQINTSPSHIITNNTLPPYCSQIGDRQVEILRAFASISQQTTKQDETRKWRTGLVYEQSDFRNDITTPEQLWERLRGSRKAAVNLERLHTACGVWEEYVADGVIEAVYIPTTGVLARLFSKSHASRLIERAEELDLLKCVDPHFCPSTPTKSRRKNGISRKFIVNPRMVELVQRTYRGVSSRGRAVGTGKDGGGGGEQGEVSSETVKELLGRYNICLSSSLRLPAHLTDEEVRACIHARFPQLTMLDTMRERINATYYAGEPTLQLHQRVKISRGATGMISKIGTRCTSGLCLLRANDIPHGYAGLTRHMFLHDYYEGRAYYEYDIKSSIYRVARFLRTGEWLEGDEDFYSLMSPYAFRNEQERADYKKLAMRLYFGGSPAKITSAFFHELRKGGMELDYSKEEVEGAVGLAQARMFEVVGESIGSEVFLHEGAIYLMVLEKLLGMGMRVVSVYDEFISDNPRLEEVCEELLPVVAAEYRERWC